VDAAVQVGADDDTLSGGCCACAARAVAGELARRAGVVRLTFVCSFVRRPGGETIEEWSVYATLEGDLIGIGTGLSQEEALINALKAAGVRT
jgi:hypothetical protein